MGLGPPVCTKCMRVLDYDEHGESNRWFCVIHGDESDDGAWLINSDGEKTRVSNVFCFSKEQAAIIYENTRKYRENLDKKMNRYAKLDR